MKIQPIKEGKFKVLAICNDNGVSLIDAFLKGVGATLKPQVAMIKRHHNTMAKEGKRGFSYSTCHCVDDREGIWELCTHKLRAFFFLGGEDVYIFTEGLIKKRDKIRAQDRQKTINLKKAYLADQKEGKLEYLPSLEEEP